MNKFEWKVIGEAGVDSGQLMVVDPCYTIGKVDDAAYDRMCTETLKPEAAGKVTLSGIRGDAIVFSSGFGDGCYPVVAKYEDCGDWGTRITEVRILMGDDVFDQMSDLGITAEEYEEKSSH